MVESEFQIEFNDPLEIAYFERFGPSIIQIKKLVGSGEEFENQAAHIVTSPEGAWFECNNLNMEFAGAVGADLSRTYPSDKEAIAEVNALFNAKQIATESSNGNESLFVIYSPDGVFDPAQMYSYRAVGGETGSIQEWGVFRPSELPMAFKYSVSGRLSKAEGTVNNGFLFYLSGVGDINIMVTVRTDGGQIIDLAPPEIIIVQ